MHFEHVDSPRLEVGLCAKVSDVAVAELAKNIIARCSLLTVVSNQ